MKNAFPQVSETRPAAAPAEAVRAGPIDISAPAETVIPVVAAAAEEGVKTAEVPVSVLLLEEQTPGIPVPLSTQEEQTAEELVPIPPVEKKTAEVQEAAHVSHPKIPVDTIEGIGPVYAEKLKQVGILYVHDLLASGASRKGREELGEKTGISPTLVLKWVNMADLMRISGVGEEYSELLEAAGVDTVKELRNRNPENLHQAMLKTNEQRKMVRRMPHLSEVQFWVEQAKQLEPVMTY